MLLIMGFSNLMLMFEAPDHLHAALSIRAYFLSLSMIAPSKVSDNE